MTLSIRTVVLKFHKAHQELYSFLDVITQGDRGELVGLGRCNSQNSNRIIGQRINWPKFSVYHITVPGLSRNGGKEWWNGTVEWKTGMTFDPVRL